MENDLLPIVKEPHKTLRARAKEVPPADIRSEPMQTLIRRMKETLRSTPDGVGLAAPQVGESLRIFIISEEAEEIDREERRRPKETKNGERDQNEEEPGKSREWKYYVFINPVIKNSSRAFKADPPEGCLSIPGKFGIVPRHQKMTMEAHDEHGKKFIRGASGFFARVMQHEIDHLNGALFIDKAEEMLKPEDGSKP